MSFLKTMGSLSWVALIFLSSGCVTHSLQTPQRSSFPRPAPTAANYKAVGLASWYGPGFYNHKTASGERFKKEELTCAHRSLPFGTRLRVTNLLNERSVEVRVNDRGPYVRNKLIDLSYAAAKEIGMFPGGSAKVSVTKLVAQADSASPSGSASLLELIKQAQSN